MTLTRLFLLLAVVGLTSCKPAPPEVAAAPQEIPAPFEADELRAALRVGTTVLYQVNKPDGTFTLRLWEVVAANELGLTVHSRAVDKDHNDIGPVRVTQQTWDDMVAMSIVPPGSEVF
jgi:hypothetical protein